MLSLVIPYQPAWKTAFEQLRQVLLVALQEFEVHIQHVGSTAVPGLCAKPVLDMDIIIADAGPVGGIARQLEALGYINRGEQGVEGRFAFRQSSGRTPFHPDGKDWQEHHLYVCYAGSAALKNHLVFRNALLQDPGLVKAYADLKLKLTSEEGMTRKRYNQLKTGFILAVLAANGFSANELDVIRKANE